MKIFSENRTLKQNIIFLLVVGWVVPVLVMSTLIATYVDKKVHEQIEQTVESSMDTAAELFAQQLAACETASKNASYYSDIRECYLAYLKNGDYRTLNSHVTNFMNSEYKYNPLIKTGLLSFTEEDMFFYAYNNSASGSYKNISFYNDTADKGIRGRALLLGTRTGLYENQGHSYLIRNLMMPDFKPYAVLSLEMNEDAFLQCAESVYGYSDAVVLFNDEYLMGTAGLLYGHVAESGIFANRSFMFEGGRIDMRVRLNPGIINRQSYAIWTIFGLILAAMIPLVIVIFRFFRVNVTAPLDVMVDAYRKIGENEYGYQIPVTAGTREFYYMQDSFNKMSDQIKQQFDQIYKEEIALRDAKIMALQSQINPHFLNNTFEIINWEARLNGNIKVSKMIEALSTMLEATMNRDGSKMHRMSEEITYVDAYAYIISERMGDNFTYIKEIDENLLSMQIPKLIIQPLMENAVNHGVTPRQHGTVWLKLYEEGEYVYIKIINESVMSREDEEKIAELLNGDKSPDRERSLRLGIRNVHNRIRLIYGDDCGLSIVNSEDRFTISTIKVKKYQTQQF